MKAPSLDTSKFQQAWQTLESLVEHRRQKPTIRSAELYYDLMAQYFKRILEAPQNSKPVAAFSVLVPPEIFYVMDIIPYHLENVVGVTAIINRQQEEFLAAAKALGLTPEVCSTHRQIGAAFSQGWAPPPQAIVWSNQVCDNTAKSNELVRDRYHIPGFYLEVPYTRTRETLSYLAQELGELIAFLEEASDTKLDWDRLCQALDCSRKIIELNSAIREMRKATPSPSFNRLGSQLLYSANYALGSPQGVAFFQAVRDDLKDRWQMGKGFIPQENYRLLSLFVPMGHDWKLLDWMEREHGAVQVADPYCCHWGEIDWDFSQPLLTLAQRLYAHPTQLCMHGPSAESVVEIAVQEAVEFKVDGAIYWAHIGCRQACAAIREVKDALREQAGVPTLALEIDINDPSFISSEENKSKLEGFFEMLDAQKE